MNWIDNIIAAVSPERAYRRIAFRQACDELRNYDAGDYRRPNQNWRVTNESGEATDRYSRDTVRARARDLERNSDIMNSVVKAYKRNVIGGGYHLQCSTKDDTLNEQLETAWKRWCKKQNCDVTGMQSLNQILRMAVARKKVDGGILIVKRYTSGGYLPFKLQIFEVDELDTMTITPRNKNNRVIGGIEYNPFNHPVGYYIRQYDLNGMQLNEAAWIEAKDVIFYFTKNRPSQVREMSDMAPTIPRIRDINEFMLAVSVKQRILACLAVFIKKAVPSVGLGRDHPAAERVDYKNKLLSPGMIQEMNAGDSTEVVNPQGQSTDATAFTKLQQRLIGAGQGISYEATSRDMSESTYSSARQGMIEDELTYAEEKELLLEVLDEIYETFVISAVLCGAVRIPDFWDNKEQYLRHTWTQEPKPWIDPQKESKATQVALATGQKTYKQIAAENGKDWHDQIDDIAEVNEYAKKKGVDMNSILFDLLPEGGVLNAESEE